MRVLKDKIMALSLEIIVFQTYDLGKKNKCIIVFTKRSHIYSMNEQEKICREKRKKMTMIEREKH